jgi:hypothetical protein
MQGLVGGSSVLREADTDLTMETVFNTFNTYQPSWREWRLNTPKANRYRPAARTTLARDRMTSTYQRLQQSQAL